MLIRTRQSELDLAIANLPLAKPENQIWQETVIKCKRAQDFAYEVVKILRLEETAAELNAHAVKIEASVALKRYGKKEKYLVLAEAFRKAKLSKIKNADGFIFPLIAAWFEAPKEFPSNETLNNALNESRAYVDGPVEPWQLSWMMEAKVRFANAQLEAWMREKKEEMVAENLNRYLEARKSKKYTERYPGEVSIRVAVHYVILKEIEKARIEIQTAARQLKSIDSAKLKSYPAFLRSEIADMQLNAEFLNKQLNGMK